MAARNPHRFVDGSVIEWVDRETIRYREGGFSVEIWVDFGGGFFARERVVDLSKVQEWTTTPGNVPTPIGDADRTKIWRRVEEYYRAHRTKLTVVGV